MFITRIVFQDFYSYSLYVTLATVFPDSRYKPSIKSDSLSGSSKCHLAYLTSSSLSLAKWATVPENSAGLTHSVYTMPEIQSMSVPTGIVQARLYPRLSCIVPFDLVHKSSSFGCFLNWTCSLHSLRVIGKMFFVSCVLGTATRRQLFLHCWLFRKHISSRRRASRTTTSARAHWSIPMIAFPCLLTSF